MTKEELEAKVQIQKDIISKAKSQICKDVEKYIESLPYWIYDRMVHKYDENPNFDYMHCFAKIINKLKQL